VTSKQQFGTSWRLVADAVRLGLGDSPDFSIDDGQIRCSVSTVRRLDVVAAAGGVGCSHLASRLSVLLANRRQSKVLGVDAAGGELTRLTRAQPRQLAEEMPARSGDGARRMHPEVSVNLVVEATNALMTGRGGLRVIQPEVKSNVVRPSDWRQSVDPVLRFFDVVVTDWGRRYPGIDFEAALDGARAVALVCRSDRGSLEQAVSIASAFPDHRVVVCSIDVDAIGPKAAQVASDWGEAPVVYVPYVPNPATSVPPFPARQALIRVASLMMRLAAGAKGGEL